MLLQSGAASHYQTISHSRGIFLRHFSVYFSVSPRADAEATCESTPTLQHYKPNIKRHLLSTQGISIMSLWTLHQLFLASLIIILHICSPCTPCYEEAACNTPVVVHPAIHPSNIQGHVVVGEVYGRP